MLLTILQRIDSSKKTKREGHKVLSFIVGLVFVYVELGDSVFSRTKFLGRRSAHTSHCRVIEK